ncbi:hypothetical protein RCH12_000905 [Cryobacterium sp. MP_3.1]|nr:hypothetical protein [Cryobacterium sp. MP_3.1]
MRYPRRAALVLGLVATLTGCATTSAQTGEGTPPPVNDVTPEPVSTSEPSRLVISSTDMQIVLEDGTVAETIAYFDPMVPAVEKITELFGSPPRVDATDGPDATDYEWPGFRLDSDGPAIEPLRPEIFVTVSVAEINDIQLETTDEHQVGDDLRPLADAHPEDSSVYPLESGEELSVKILSVPVETGDADRAFRTGLSADPADGVIRQIHAPEKNFE